MRDLSPFTGQLPYATELCGVFEPLLGWKSSLTQARVSQVSIRNFPRYADVETDPNRRTYVRIGADHEMTISAYGEVNSQNGRPDLFRTDQPARRLVAPALIDGVIVRTLQADAAQYLDVHPATELAWWADYWAGNLKQEALEEIAERAINDLIGVPVFMPQLTAMNNPVRQFIGRLRMMHLDTAAAARHLFDREVHIARYLHSLMPAEGRGTPAFAVPINRLLLQEVKVPAIEDVLEQVSPLALGKGASRDAVISPLGVLHTFRQYFFEFTNFLGPAVEHVWLAPGSKTELLEISTRRVLQERSIEQIVENIIRSDNTTTMRDELSEAITETNQRDTKLASSVHGIAVVPVFAIEAEGSASVNETAKHSQEVIHKQLREQSSKLSTEIRSNFKSTFKTVVDTTDVRSRRHSIENPSDKLINYELRRKMRQVGIQQQYIGTQLCWQVYVDDPGAPLGVGQLVHLATKLDLSEFVHLPEPRRPRSEIDVVTLSLPVPPKGKQASALPILAAGFVGLAAGSLPGAAVAVAAHQALKDIFGGDDEEENPDYDVTVERAIRQRFKIPLPQGYEIDDTQDTTDTNFPVGQGKIPTRWLGINGGGQFQYYVNIANAAEGEVELVVFDGMVTPGEMIDFEARIKISPTPASLAAVDAANAAVAAENAKRDQAKERAIRKELVDSVRERVRLASEVHTRPAAELREEERTVIYRKLIHDLMRRDAWFGADRKLAHLRSELIKAIFDVDRMMYFVAPEWWQARPHSSQSFEAVEQNEADGFTRATRVSSLEAAVTFEKHKRSKTKIGLGALGRDDIVGWGGEGRQDNYLITEDSRPARLGSSLGWLIQLDGDSHRNAFLNAPWVKAVIPIRHGREHEALEWLKQSTVEGTEGLDEEYGGGDREYFQQQLLERYGEDRPVTIDDMLKLLAEDIVALHKEGNVPTVVAEPDGGPAASFLPAEEVFEKGFDPLPGSFRVTVDPQQRYKPFSQWIEVLPTDQIAAVQVSYDPKTGAML
ncbi:hypothetical protein [Methylibium rhizosphaerae]|uniref:hypothetical protein n=1 Tax=Methylibium rhizosphaerae TaxID=2570323 RepID=UPI001129BBBE|nr:hypothetical protein [Methylibium rhizosphaerae]